MAKRRRRRLLEVQNHIVLGSLPLASAVAASEMVYQQTAEQLVRTHMSEGVVSSGKCLRIPKAARMFEMF